MSTASALSRPRPAAPAVLPLSPAAPAPRPLRVLVVANDAEAVESLAALLTSWGYRPAVAYDGRAALAVAPLFRPHVVLLDINLPGMDGYDLARRLRDLPSRAPGGSGGPLVVLTGSAGGRSREAGGGHHLLKPGELDVLQHLLQGCGRAQDVPALGLGTGPG